MLLAVVIFLIHGLFATPARANMVFDVGGEPLYLMGYTKLTLGWGVGEKDFNSKKDFQSLVYSVLLEGQYRATDNLKFFVSGMLNGDLAYEILNDDSEWKQRKFSESRDRLAHDTEFNDLLQEAHVTWTVGDLFLRVGKQIVVWGETDGFRIMDQNNPLDQRRGISDVEFESSIVPIWLVRAEYNMTPDSTWLENLGVEVVFNPNARFQANRPIMTGNDATGVWAPHVEIAMPTGVAHMGSMDLDLETYDAWDSDAFEYGLRLKAVIKGAIITLNYFYGIDNDYAAINLPAMPRFEVSPYDGSLIAHVQQKGYYPLFRIAGMTFTQSLDSLNVSALGGVAPVLRFEGFYAFDSTFTTNLAVGDRFEQHDEIRYAIGLDWKIKVGFLNPKAYFMISPQFFHRHIMDFPSDYRLVAASQVLKQDNYYTSLMISTSYFHNKIQPSIFWLRDYTTKSGFVRPQIVYEYDDAWKFTLGAIFIEGDVVTEGYESLAHKDHVYLTVEYRF